MGNTEKSGKKTAFAKEKITIIILAALALILGAVYLILVMFGGKTQTVYSPYDSKGDRLDYTFYAKKGQFTKTEKDDGSIVIETDGEVEVTTKPFIFEEIARNDVAEIKVENQYGGFTVYRDEYTGNFFFKGNEYQLYDHEGLEYMIFYARSFLADSRLEENYNTQEELASFGLDEKSQKTIITVTDNKGNSNTVYVGSKLVTDTGYYAKHADKPYVYVVSINYELFMRSVNNYLSPIIAEPLSNTEYSYVDEFDIAKNGEMFMASRIVPEEMRSSTGKNDLHRLTYPGGYSASLSSYYSALYNFIDIKGSQVVETNVLKNSTEERAAELFEKYGFAVPSNDVYYSYNGKARRFITGNKFTDSDGKTVYYAYSYYMDTIVKLPLENAPFLEYELIDFIDVNIFRTNINNVKSINVRYSGKEYEFTLSGYGKELEVKEERTGRKIDVDSFRQFYISLLNIKIEGYDTDKTASCPTEFEFDVSTSFDELYRYSFGTISTTRSRIKLDEDSEFYTNRAYITTAIEKLDALMRGEKLEADY
ncbi:MAG: DUF4340 domain-containing protein [Clostridiales bacterium]|nr:DUF4340 domain-containing protein [Clostridiales bacterium]